MFYYDKLLASMNFTRMLAIRQIINETLSLGNLFVSIAIIAFYYERL